MRSTDGGQESFPVKLNTDPLPMLWKLGLSGLCASPRDSWDSELSWWFDLGRGGRLRTETELGKVDLVFGGGGSPSHLFSPGGNVIEKACLKKSGGFACVGVEEVIFSR